MHSCANDDSSRAYQYFLILQYFNFQQQQQLQLQIWSSHCNKRIVLTERAKIQFQFKYDDDQQKSSHQLQQKQTVWKAITFQIDFA